MGKFISVKHIPDAIESLCLIVYLNTDSTVKSSAVSVGQLLAEALLHVEPRNRSRRLEKIFQAIIGQFPSGAVIKDIDVMFNPAYEIDVLRVLTAAYRKRPFKIIWPGGYINGKLTYSEAQYEDYKEYAIEDYDILCVE